MSFEVTVTPTVYDVEVAVNPSVQPFDVEVTVGNVPDLDLTTNGDSGASTFDPLTGELNIPNYTLDGLGGVPESRTLTINGTTQDLSANRTFTIPAPDPVTIGSPANGLAIDGNQVLTIGLASGSQAGALSSTDWSTFNDKQDVLTNPVTGTGVAGQVSFWTGTGTQSGDNGLFWDDTNKRLGIGTNAPIQPLHVTERVQLGESLILGTGGSTNNQIILNTTGSLAGIYSPSYSSGSTNIISFKDFSGTTKIRLFSTGNVLIQNGGTFTDAGFRLDVNGTARVQGAITTGAPTGGTAKPFKIGAVATVTPTSPNRTIEIEIDGTTYYLTAKTTND